MLHQHTLKYDSDIKPLMAKAKRGAKVQFKDILGIGVALQFSEKRE